MFSIISYILGIVEHCMTAADDEREQGEGRGATTVAKNYEKNMQKSKSCLSIIGAQA